MRCAYNVPVTFQGIFLRSNHERIRMKRFESSRIRVEELIARTRQDICGEVCGDWDASDAFSDDLDSGDGWFEISDSD